MAGERFLCIEGARAVFALWVFASHLLLQSGLSAHDLPWPLSVVRTGGWAVQGFMAISGFVITHMIITQQETYPQYIARRWFRLMPLLAVCIGFILIWGLFDKSTYRWNHDFTAEYLAGYATMLHGAVPAELVPRAERAILAPAWSVSLEWQFYLIAPLLLAFRARVATVVALTAAWLFVTPGLISQTTGMTFKASFLPLSFGWFALGILSYFAVEKWDFRYEAPIGSGFAVALASFVAFESYPLAAWLFVLAAILGDRSASFALSGRTLVWLGTISYSIYLIHEVVLIPTRKILVGKVIGLEFGTWSHCAASTLIAVPITIFLSAVAYRFVEKPGKDQWKRFSFPPPVRSASRT